MDSQYKLLSELLSDQAAFITSPKTSLANYWGALPPCSPPVSTGLIASHHRFRIYYVLASLSLPFECSVLVNDSLFLLVVLLRNLVHLCWLPIILGLSIYSLVIVMPSASWQCHISGASSIAEEVNMYLEKYTFFL